MWARLKGEKDILATEAFGLSSLFDVELSYLFSHELSISDGKTSAYYRWYEWNQKKKRDAKISKLWYQIGQELKEKPYLFDFMKAAISFSPDQIQAVMDHMGQAFASCKHPEGREVCRYD